MKSNWVQLLLCLLLSAGIWLIHNLSQTYVSLVSVPVAAESNIEGHAGASTTEATVTAQVRASGFRHARMSGRYHRPIRVSVSPSDFRREGDNLYSIPVSNLYKYSSQIFGDGVSIESIVSEAPRFVFPAVAYRKVPVRKVQSLDFEPQYMATRPMTLQPDSVLVYGEPARIESIEYVLTRPIDLWNIRSSVHGSVRLEVPSGVRLSETEVAYSMEVSRYVEVTSEVDVETRNVPRGSELVVLPSRASVTFRCVFPMGSDPAKNARFYVDYSDFAGSITGRCVARTEDLPSGVISWNMVPEVFDCIVRTSEQR